MTINKEYKDKIKKIFDRVYNEFFKAKYFFEKPYLKIYDCSSSMLGSYCFQGFSYSDNKPTIKININESPSLDRIEQTIRHEMAHMANHINLGHTKNPSHNIGFWKLAKKMGVKKESYAMGITKAMERAWK
jgi:hypothetical protein